MEELLRIIFGNLVALYLHSQLGVECSVRGWTEEFVQGRLVFTTDNSGLVCETAVVVGCDLVVGLTHRRFALTT